MTALKTSKFCPRPAELRELVQGSASEQAETAWNELLREIRATGYTGRPTLPEATREVIAEMCGDWIGCCMSIGMAEGPELLGWAKRFKNNYASSQRVAERLALPLFPPAKELAE